MGQASTTEAPKPTEPEKASEKPEASKDVTMTDKPKENETEGLELDNMCFQDPAFLSDLLGSLPGVDVNDPRIQEALKAVGTESTDSKTDEAKKKEEEEKK